MNHSKQSIRARNNAAPSRMALAIASTLVLVMGITEASAGNRGGGGGARAGGGGQMAASSVSGANRSASANRGNVNTGNVNRGNINTGNVNVGNDVDINIDGGYHGGYNGRYYRPVAAGVVIGAMAVTTAAVMGSYYYSLPPSGCTVVVRTGVNYHYCGSVYYQQTWSGDKVVYVVVTP